MYRCYVTHKLWMFSALSHLWFGSPWSTFHAGPLMRLRNMMLHKHITRVFAVAKVVRSVPSPGQIGVARASERRPAGASAGR